MAVSSASSKRSASPSSGSGEKVKASKAKPTKQKKRPVISQETREIIIAEQKKRWAELEKEAAKDMPSPTSSATPKRAAAPTSVSGKKGKISQAKSDRKMKPTMPPEAREKIAADQRKRWEQQQEA